MLYIKGIVKIFKLTILTITILSIFALVKVEASPSHRDTTEEYAQLTSTIQVLAQSEKALSILKLEYKIKNLPEFVVIRKIQTSILQTFYAAFDIGFVGTCYQCLDYNDKVKMKRFYSLFLELVANYNESSKLTIAIIEQNLSINDCYLEKQYPDFANILNDLKINIASLRNYINEFVTNNIPEEYFKEVGYKIDKLAKKKENDISLAHVDYIPPRSFIEHLGNFLKKYQPKNTVLLESNSKKK